MAQRSRKAVISEEHVQETCSILLSLDGWRRVKTDPKHIRGMGVQEPGMADDLFIRNMPNPASRASLFPNMTEPQRRAEADVMWIEWKAPKRSKTQQNQHDWHLKERLRGGLTLKAVEDFEPTVEGFAHWYNEKSGLAILKLRIK